VTSRTALLRLHYAATFAAIGAYNPFFPSWLRAHGIDGFAMSAIVSLNPTLGILSPVIFGVIADRFGLRGSLLRTAAAGAFLPFGIMTVLGVLHRGQGGPAYGTLFGLVALFAFFRSPLVTIADVTALEEAASYARTRRFGSLGFAAMAAVCGWTIDVTSSWQLPALVTGALGVTVVVASSIRERPSRPPSPVGKDVFALLRSRDYSLLLLGVFLWNAAHASYDLCFSLHLKDLGASSGEVGTSWAIGVVAELFLLGAAPRLFTRFTAEGLLVAGVSTTAARFLAIALVHSRASLIALQPLHAVTFGLTWISGLEYVKRRAPANVLATAQSSFAVATALGSAVGTLAWGPLYAKHGGAAVFGTAAAVAAIGLAVVLLLHGARNRLVR
jgi:PPP family 3-phenylpropionic acid transporter